MATQLSRTFSSQGNQRKFTISTWVKRNKIGSVSTIMGSGGSGAYASHMYFMANDQFEVWNWFNSSYNGRYRTSAKYRDKNAWYHVVIAVDTTQATDTDRFKLYINGELITDYDVRNNVSQNQTWEIGHTGAHYIGGNNSADFDGYMSHFHYCDAQQYAASDFGETDSTTGEWKIKTSPSVSYGVSGSFILKDGASLTDQSGLGNNWSVDSGTLIKSEDCPSNNFATMNTRTWYDGNIYYGGNRVTTDQSAYRYQTASIGVYKGRWYWEAKFTTAGDYALIGITDAPNPPNAGSNWILGSGSYDYSVVYNTAGGNGHKYNNAGTSPTNTPGAFMGGFAQGNIFTFALDLDSATKKLYVGVNGSWADGSGNTNQTFANATGFSIVIPQNTSGGFYFPACGDYGGGSSVFDFNFGNGSFGASAISSAGTNASGNGIFEYDVPSGYTALSSKGLNL